MISLDATRKLLWLSAITPQDRDNPGNLYGFDAGAGEGSLSPAAFTDGADTPQVVNLSASFSTSASLAIELTGLPVTKDLSNWRLTLHATELAFAESSISLTSSNPATHRFQWDVTGLPVDDSDLWDDEEPFTVSLQEAINLSATGVPTISGTPQVGETLSAAITGIADGNGLDNASYTYQWTAGGSNIDGATGSSLTLTSSQESQTVQVRESFTDDDGFGETATSVASSAVAAAPAEANKPATGLPTISGTPQVEQTLTADTAGISDQDGLSNVSYSYQWMAGGADIDGATGDSLALTTSQHGQTIQVKVSFTDDAGNNESLTSEATDAVAAKPTPLTASFSGVPSSHDGSSAFKFDLSFSENVKAGYQRIQDDAFTISGGNINQAQRKQQGSNQNWTITVEPDGNGTVSITLPETTDCDAAGAICTAGGKKLSGRVELTVNGPEPPPQEGGAGTDRRRPADARKPSARAHEPDGDG